MKRLFCRLRGHQPVRVSQVGYAPHGLMLPNLDGVLVYAPDPDGDHAACVRCRSVLS